MGRKQSLKESKYWTYIYQVEALLNVSVIAVCVNRQVFADKFAM